MHFPSIGIVPAFSLDSEWEDSPFLEVRCYVFDKGVEQVLTNKENEKNTKQPRTNIHPITYIGKQALTPLLFPTLERVKEVFANFTKNNSLEKFEEQRKKTDGRCAIRAHVLSLFLDVCRVFHKKIFKVWDCSQFKWNFHCVILITTDKKEKFIADFWEEKTLELIPFKEWILKKEEALPDRVIVTGTSVIADFETGKEEAMGIRRNLHPSNLEALDYLVSAIFSDSTSCLVRNKQEEYDKKTFFSLDVLDKW